MAHMDIDRISRRGSAAGSRASAATGAYPGAPGSPGSPVSHHGSNPGSPGSPGSHAGSKFNFSQGGGHSPRSHASHHGSHAGSRTSRAKSQTGADASVLKKGPETHMKKPPQELDPADMILTQFRKTIKARGGNGGMAAISRSFRLGDRDKSGKIDQEEFKIAMSRFGMKLDEKGCKMLLDIIDKDGSGKVDQTEFLNAVRGPMPKRRITLIDMAFKVLDKSGDGVVTIEDLKCYNAAADSDVKEGRCSKEEAMQAMLNNFDENKDGTVTKEEFREYYKNVSSSIDDDDYFELMIRNAWHIPGGKGACANTSNARVLVDFADGEQKVVCIEDDLGLDLHNREAVIGRLKKQGVKNIVGYSVSG